MQSYWVPIALLSCLGTFALSLPADEQKGSAPMKSYPYGTTTCLQGNEGQGLRLFLRQKLSCEGRASCPYLEVDVTEEPVPVHNGIRIGADNRAFRCLNAKDSCEQAVSGNVIFDHFEDTSGASIRTDGQYDLKFSPGKSESGLFKVTCFSPCG